MHQFVKVKKYLVFILDKFGGRETETQHHVQLKKTIKNKTKRKLQAHNDEVQSHNWPPGAVQGKSKQILCRTEISGSRCVRSGWHAVGLTFMKGEKSSDGKCLCRLFLVPLGIPANLHLCQLDVADDISVWKTKTGRKRLIYFLLRQEMCMNVLINLPPKLKTVLKVI